MLDSCKMVKKQSEAFYSFLWHFFPSLKQNFIAYRSSKVSSRPECIFEIHQLWQSNFSRVYSNSYCRCSFEAEIIKIGHLSHKLYSNKILNFQESTTILNTCTKKCGILLNAPRKSLLSAAQNNTIRRNYVKVKIDKMQQNSKCRLCSDRDETTDPLISEYSKFAQKSIRLDTAGWWRWSTRKCARNWNRPYKRVVYWQPGICPEEWDAQTSLVWWDTNGSFNLRRTTRPCESKKKKKKKLRTCRIVDFVVPADHRVKLKESEKEDEYLELARELKKTTMEHEGDGDTSCNWRTRNDPLKDC